MPTETASYDVGEPLRRTAIAAKLETARQELQSVLASRLLLSSMSAGEISEVDRIALQIHAVQLSLGGSRK